MVGGVIEHQSGVPPSLKLRRAGKPQHSTKNPTPRVTGEWGWKVGWFSEAGLLAATEYERESTEAEKGGGGGFWDRFDVDLKRICPTKGGV